MAIIQVLQEELGVKPQKCPRFAAHALVRKAVPHVNSGKMLARLVVGK